MQELILPPRTRRVIHLGRHLLLLAILAALSLFGADHAAAQAIKLTRPRPRPDLFVFASLTVTATPATVSFALVHGGAAVASSAVSVTTSYTLALSLAGTLNLYAYFSSASNALTGGSPSSSIPSSDVFGQDTSGLPTSYTAFTQTTPYGGASGLQLYNQTSIVNLASGSRTDSLNLKIDLTATPQLPAATYTGTLSFEAQAF